MNKWTKWVGRLAVAITAVAATTGAGAVVTPPALTVTFASGSTTTVIGLNNVNVGDTLYNISFGDTWGSSPSFSTLDEAKKANDALFALFSQNLDPLVNPLYTLDLYPRYTAGCGYIPFCTMLTSYENGAANSTTVSVFGVKNQSSFGSDSKNISFPSFPKTGISVANPSNDFYTVATWTPVVSAVPEPETYAMMLAGLGLMGAIARRRNAKRA